MELRREIPEQARSWRNHPEIYRYCRQRTLLSEEEHQGWLDRISQDKSILMFGIYEDELPLGVTGLTSIDPINQHAEFSLYIRPDMQRQGLGKKALLLLFHVGFYDLNLQRIWGETYEYNEKAQKSFESLGLRLEGRLRKTYFKEGRYIDSLIYSMLRSEYAAQYGRHSHFGAR